MAWVDSGVFFFQNMHWMETTQLVDVVFSSKIQIGQTLTAWSNKGHYITPSHSCLVNLAHGNNDLCCLRTWILSFAAKVADFLCHCLN